MSTPLVGGPESAPSSGMRLDRSSGDRSLREAMFADQGDGWRLPER